MKKMISLILVTVCLLMSFAATETLAACNHNWVLVHKDEDGAPCKGYNVTYRCNVCGDMKAGTLAPTADHNWKVAYSDPVECFKDGYVSYYCIDCSELKDEVIPAYGSHDHTFYYNNDATCTKDGTKIGTCKRCGVAELLTDVGSAKGHSYNENWTVTFEGNCIRLKSIKRNCKTCGEPQVRYDGYGPHADKNQDYKCDLCSADLSPTSENPGASDNVTKDCSCKCHKGGITGFFWKIGNFFAKLFRIKSKQICACGVYHF